MKEQVPESSLLSPKITRSEKEKGQKPFFSTRPAFFHPGIVQQKQTPFFEKTPATPFFQPVSHPSPPQSNKTGLPDQLKTGLETLSGISLEEVRVHRNDERPAQLQAHAYAQGTDIHLGPGQEKHLPHEAWHVVQQKQGRVKPTRQLRGKVPVNDEAGLEKEADVMGKKALQFAEGRPETLTQRKSLMSSPMAGESHEALSPDSTKAENGKISPGIRSATPVHEVVQRHPIVLGNDALEGSPSDVVGPLLEKKYLLQEFLWNIENYNSEPIDQTGYDGIKALGYLEIIGEIIGEMKEDLLEQGFEQYLSRMKPNLENIQAEYQWLIKKFPALAEGEEEISEEEEEEIPEDMPQEEEQDRRTKNLQILEPQDKKTSPEGKVMIALFMGQGLCVDMKKFILYSGGFNTCSPVVMFNEGNQRGGLFHFPAAGGGAIPESSKRSLRQMMEKIAPTLVRVENRQETMKDKADYAFGAANDAENIKLVIESIANEIGIGKSDLVREPITIGATSYTFYLDSGNVPQIIAGKLEGKYPDQLIGDDRTKVGREKIKADWQRKNYPKATKVGKNKDKRADWN